MSKIICRTHEYYALLDCKKELEATMEDINSDQEHVKQDEMNEVHVDVDNDGSSNTTVDLSMRKRQKRADDKANKKAKADAANDMARKIFEAACKNCTTLKLEVEELKSTVDKLKEVNFDLRTTKRNYIGNTLI